MQPTLGMSAGGVEAPVQVNDAPRWLVALQVLGGGIWLGLVTWKLALVPGMSMDEAWFIISARGQWAPVNPLSGMTSYTGVFPVLLLELFGTGAGLLVLRGASVLAHASLLLVLGLMLRQQYSRRALAGWSLPLIATCPAWLIPIRTGIEVTMFTAPLALVGLYLFSLGTIAWTFAAGIVWGLLVYNHVLGLWAVGAISSAWLVVYRRAPPGGWWPALAGFAVGLLPRLLAVALYDNAQITDAAAAVSPTAAFADLLSLPEALWEMLLGRPVYLRYVGRIVEEIRPYWLIGLVMLLPWLRHWRELPRAAWFALLAVTASFVLTTLGSPYIETRYFILPILGVPALLVLLGAGAIERDRRWAHVVRAAAGLLVLGNLYYLFTNFYLPWERRQLGMTAFHLGTRSPPIGSWHFLPKDELVRQLRELDPAPEQIIATHSISRPLRALMGDTGIAVVSTAEANRKLRSVFIDYRSRRTGPRYCVPVRGRKKMCFTEPSLVDQHYMLYHRGR
jgi:hypothetical protein